MRPPCGGTEAHRTLDNLEQGLLDAFTRDIAGDGGVFRLARDLVDFVNEDDAALGLLDVVVALRQQLGNDVFDILAHIASFGQRGRIGDHEGNIEHLGQRLGQVGLARAGRADQQDVRLGQFDITGGQLAGKTLVVVVDRNCKNLLGAILTDHILVEVFADVSRQRQCLAFGRLDLGHASLARLFPDDVLAQCNALVADENIRPGYQLGDFMLALAAEGTVKKFVARFGHIR